VYSVLEYAIKCPKVPVPVGSQLANELKHEVALMLPFMHIPNIASVKGWFARQNNICIVLEKADSTLGDKLADRSLFRLTYQERLEICLGIIRGLAEIHLAGVVHRDFKPENVLMKKEGDKWIPMISDFGSSFLILTNSASNVRDSAGTIGYDAPEVAVDNQVPSFASDIYALSFTLYEILTEKRPFAGLKPSQILTKFTIQHKRPTEWNVDISNGLKQLITLGWNPQPQCRPLIGAYVSMFRLACTCKVVSCNQVLAPFTAKVSLPLNTTLEQVLLKFPSHFDRFVFEQLMGRVVVDDFDCLQMLFSSEHTKTLLERVQHGR
jgi:serine/threonine protein kinase